jgi:hypothetical protein
MVLFSGAQTAGPKKTSLGEQYSMNFLRQLTVLPPRKIALN